MLPLAATEVNHFLTASEPIGAQHPLQPLNRLEGIYLSSMREGRGRGKEVSKRIHIFIVEDSSMKKTSCSTKCSLNNT